MQLNVLPYQVVQQLSVDMSPDICVCFLHDNFSGYLYKSQYSPLPPFNLFYIYLIVYLYNHMKSFKEQNGLGWMDG